MKLLANYKNGNAIVKVFSDGTRECCTEDDKFNFEYPMNADIKISNRCSRGCNMCHENSIPEGKNAPLENFGFLRSWAKGVEAAFGGGSVTEHPQFVDILKLAKECGVISNATFHQDELVENFELIKSLQEQKLLYGIGVSYSHEDDKLVECVEQLDNVVFHVIAGLVDYDEFAYLSDNFENCKVLILGYKHAKRGNILYDKIGVEIEIKIKSLNRNLDWLFKNFNVISFDNLALSQLNVRKHLTQNEWNEFYQGDEGTCSMYIDAVEGKFAQNSTAVTRYDLTDNIKEMFEIIKGKNNEQ